MKLNESMRNIKKWKGIFERLNGEFPDVFIDVYLDFENFEIVVSLNYENGCFPGYFHIQVPEFKEIEEIFRINHTMDRGQWKFFFQESMGCCNYHPFAFWACWLSL